MIVISYWAALIWELGWPGLLAGAFLFFMVGYFVRWWVHETDKTEEGSLVDACELLRNAIMDGKPLAVGMGLGLGSLAKDMNEVTKTVTK